MARDGGFFLLYGTLNFTRLRLKGAAFINDHFGIVQPLGTGNLAERSEKPFSVRTALSYTDQLLEALSHAHHKRLRVQGLCEEPFSEPSSE